MKLLRTAIFLALTLSASVSEALTIRWNAVVNGTDGKPLVNAVTQYDVYRCDGSVTTGCTKSVATKVGSVKAPAVTLDMPDPVFPSVFFVIAINVRGEAGASQPIVVQTVRPTTVAGLTIEQGSGIIPPPVPPTPPPPPPSAWTFCSLEFTQCNFTGTKEVRYGAAPPTGTGVYFSVVMTNGVFCDNSVFGDPSPGIIKQCEYRDTTLPPIPPTTGATYHVNKLGSNSNSCAQATKDGATAKLTMGGPNGGYQCAKPGDRVLVHAGIYVDTISIFHGTPMISGTANALITLEGAPGEKVIWRSAGGFGNSGERHWTSYNISYIRIKGFDTDGASRFTNGDYNNGIAFQGVANGIRIESMFFHDMASNCLMIGDGPTESRDAYIGGNKFGQKCGWDPNSKPGPGYHIYGLGSYAIVERNIFEGAAGYSLHLHSNDYPFTGHKIRFNIFRKNNIAQGTGLPFDRELGSLVATRGTTEIYDNIFIDEKCSAIQIGGWGGDAKIINNTMIRVGTGCSNPKAINFTGSQATADRSQVKNNLLLESGPLEFTPAGNNTATNMTGTVAEHLVSEATARLLPASRARNAGTTLGAPYDVDYYGTKRTGAWDIGAVEE